MLVLFVVCKYLFCRVKFLYNGLDDEIPIWNLLVLPIWIFQVQIPLSWFSLHIYPIFWQKKIHRALHPWNIQSQNTRNTITRVRQRYRGSVLSPLLTVEYQPNRYIVWRHAKMQSIERDRTKNIWRTYPQEIFFSGWFVLGFCGAPNRGNWWMCQYIAWSDQSDVCAI